MNMHKVAEGVAVARYRVPNRPEHLRKPKDQSDAKLMKSATMPSGTRRIFLML